MNYEVQAIKAHKGNVHKQQQVGDNAIYHCKNPHTRFHVAVYMAKNGINSRFDLNSVIDNAKKAM